MAKHEYSGVTEQRKAATKRLRDAEALLAEEPDENWLRVKGLNARGAMYLGGYAVECKLKAIAMEIYRCQTLAQLARKWDVDERDVYTHGLEPLAQRLPLWPILRRSTVWLDFRGQVNLWRPSWRYDPEDWLNAHALAFIRAVRRVYNWLDTVS